MPEKEERKERPLSVKVAIVFLAVPIVLYFLVKAFKIEPWRVLFGFLLFLHVLIPLAVGMVLLVFLVSLFSGWLEGKGSSGLLKIVSSI